MPLRIFSKLTVGAWLGLMLLAGAAFAQSSIGGRVTDASGAALPGVTVEVASPVLIEKVRTAITDGQGRYSVIDLRPGPYRATFTLVGFRTLAQDGIELPSNFAATVNAELEVGGIEETVTVTGASPVVDVTNAQRTSVLKRELLESLPTVRTFQGEVVAVVGVKGSDLNVGGARPAVTIRLTVHGTQSRDTTVSVDGIKMNQLLGSGDSHGEHNTAMYQEMTVQTSALGAEVSAGGLYVNLVPLDGGNAFRGSTYVGYSDASFQTNNLTAELIQQGLRTPDALNMFYDSNVSISGPVKKDKVWFFGSVRNGGSHVLSANSYYPDGRPPIQDQRLENYTLRLTWQATPRNKITAYDDYQPKFVGHELVAGTRTDLATAAWRRDCRQRFNDAVKWTSATTSRLLLEAAVGTSANCFARSYQPGVKKEPGTPEWYAGATRQDLNLSTRTTAASMITNTYYFAHTFNSSLAYVTGSHTFKTGLQWRFGSARQHAQANADLAQRYRDGVPDSVLVYNTPKRQHDSLNADLGLYLQDSWTIKRLTLTPGIRYEYFNSSIEAGAVEPGRFVPFREFARKPDVPEWSDLAPRLGIVYDLTGDATTAIKGSVNRYNRNYAADVAARYNAFNSQSDARNWFDCDLIPGTSTCSGRVLPTNRDDIAQDNEIGPSNNLRFGLGPARKPDPDLKRPYDIEFSLGIDRQLFTGVSVIAAWYRRDTYRQERQTNLLVDVSDYASFQTPSPLNGELLAIYNLNRAKQGLVDLLDTTSTDRSKNRVTYNGFEASFAARLPRGGNFLGGWSADKLITVSCDGNNPNTFRYCDQSQLAIPFRHDLKFTGSYPFPLGMRVGASLQNLAGGSLAVNWAVPVNLFPGGRTEPVTVALIPPGSKFLKRVNQLDLSVRRIFRIGRAQVDGNLDVYNLFNTNVVTLENQNFGSALGRPQEIVVGRLLRISSQLRF